MPANRKRRLFLALLSALLLASTGVCSRTNPNFSGTWKQSNERCTPKRTGDVTLHIDHRDPDLIVETTVVRSSGPPRHAVQRYSTDSKTSVSTGADGDEFHTSVTWSGLSMVFAVEEHEDGRILLSKETWTLIDNGTVLRRVREHSERGEQQTLIYIR
jgi:hypothetical protein